MRSVRPVAGFTMIELLITVVIGAILLAVAVPSFRGYTTKKKVEGTLSELATDIQLARGEAVSRNSNTTMAFGTNCYAIFVPVTATVNSACVVSGAGAVNIRTVSVEDTSKVTLAPVSTLTSLEFDSVRGAAALNGVATDEAGVDVKTASGISPSVNLRAVVSKFGRVRVCTTNGVAGYGAC